MNGHSAWFLPGGRWSDPTHRYGTIYTLRVPTRDVPENVFLEFCCQDAYADPAQASSVLDREWSRAVQRGGWALCSKGACIQGWAAGRVAVDLGKRGPWDWLRRYARTYARADGFQRIHWDDVSLHPILAGVEGAVNCAAWEQYASAFQQHSCLPTDSINGGKDWLCPRDVPPQTILLESPRFALPWGARPGHEYMDWRVWAFGHPDFGPGIKGITRSGRSCVFHCYIPEGWTEARKMAHVAVLMGTSLLWDNCSLMIHDKADRWYERPLWFPACDWPEQLGAPTLKMGQWQDKRWRRQYHGGTVSVADDGRDATIE